MPTRRTTAASAEAATMTVNFTKEKETKGTWRYAEEGDDPSIGTLYLKNKAVEALGQPEKLSVVVTVVK